MAEGNTPQGSLASGHAALLRDRVAAWMQFIVAVEHRTALRRTIALLAMLGVMALADQVVAHGLEDKDAAFVANNHGPQVFAFLYLGAKHMVTGYDHLLFLLGVIFFVHSLRNVVLYVSLFSIGHSLTLLFGVLGNVHVNAHLVDAVIGLSVAYKAFDNLAGFKTVFGFQPNTRLVVFGFGLVHGFGLATKLQALRLLPDGLVVNILSFNIGVEIGQCVALAALLAIMTAWRATRGFGRQAVIANVLILTAGFVILQDQLVGYWTGSN